MLCTRVCQNNKLRVYGFFSWLFFYLFFEVDLLPGCVCFLIRFLFLLFLLLLLHSSSVQILTRLYTLFLFDFISIIEFFFFTMRISVYVFLYFFISYFIPSHNLESFCVSVFVCLYYYDVVQCKIDGELKLVNRIGDDVRTVIDRSKIE